MSSAAAAGRSGSKERKVATTRSYRAQGRPSNAYTIRRGLMPSDRRRVLPLLSACKLLPQPATLWEDAGDIGALVKSSGKAVKTLNLLIATYAPSHRSAILTTDRDFHHIRDAGVALVVI